MAPTLSISDLQLPRSHPVAYPLQLDKAHCRHTYNGSAAIYQAAIDMQLQAGDAVLMPAYCCGAELGPFEQLDCEFVFYDVHANLQVNVEQITDHLNKRPAIRLLLVTHYMGMPQPDVAELAQICRSRHVALLEDCAHALYCHLDGIPLGSFGDYAIFSPRKSLPLTEGGLLAARQALVPLVNQTMAVPQYVPQLDRLSYSFQQGLRSQKKAILAAILSKLGIALWALPAVTVKLIKVCGLIPSHAWLTPDVEGAEAEPIYFQSSSRLSRRILIASNPSDIIARRRMNYARWVECLAGYTNTRILIPTLPDGCCPLYFLLDVNDPAACVEALRKCNIEAFNWWQHMSDRINWQDYPEARRLKQSLLALPVHQKLLPEQINSMATELIRIIALSKSQA